MPLPYLVVYNPIFSPCDCNKSKITGTTITIGNNILAILPPSYLLVIWPIKPSLLWMNKIESDIRKKQIAVCKAIGIKELNYKTYLPYIFNLLLKVIRKIKTIKDRPWLKYILFLFIKCN